jgi:peptidoglycan/LPS O-acetylase OafA/YrhL
MLASEEAIRRRVSANLTGHIPGLDALRGIAVLWIIWHNTFGDFPLTSLFSRLLALFTNAGWVGVQLFFVLSGFLITGILLALRAKQGTFRRKFSTFYIRRSLRIFPLYYFVLVICFVVIPVMGIQHEGLELARQGQLWYWTYMINWKATEIGGLPHIWSLAIEEQFYLIWPFFVLALSRNMLINISVFLILSALFFRVGLMLTAPDLYDGAGGYTYTIARWDALGFGALLAILVRNESSLRQLIKWSDSGLVLLVTVILLVVVATENFGSTPVGVGVTNQSASAALFALIIFAIIKQEANSWVARLVSHPLLNLVGKYSYALYIFHLPVRHFWNAYFFVETAERQDLQLLLAGGLNFLGIFMLSFALAALSWYLLENPILRYKERFQV